MDGRWIKNWQELAITPGRVKALRIAEAGLDAISTRQTVIGNVHLAGDILRVADNTYDLSKFKRLRVLGFGKASGEVARALCEVAGDRISDGIMIGLEDGRCGQIELFKGTHPRPSYENFKLGERVKDWIGDVSEDDLFIVAVSGGGSALLCYPESEYKQGEALYNTAIKAGINISELNTVRKHLSEFKGGGLMKFLYPATVVSLIFSDVPGDDYASVASGATYKDETTIADAEEVANKYQLGNFEFLETPKEDKYFSRVANVVLVSNKIAVDAMARAAEALGLSAKIISKDIYGPIENVFSDFMLKRGEADVLIGAGEPGFVVKKTGGSGGRNLYLGMTAILGSSPGGDSVFVSLASDGRDNSDAAGAIVDQAVMSRVSSSGIDIKKFLDNYDAFNFFKELGDGMIFTGATGANVSDLMILVNKND